MRVEIAVSISGAQSDKKREVTRKDNISISKPMML
jgi:hypothetical protein